MDFICIKKTKFFNPASIAVIGAGIIASGGVGGIGLVAGGAGAVATAYLHQTCEYQIYMNLMTLDIPDSECSVEGGRRKRIVPTADGNEELCL